MSRSSERLTGERVEEIIDDLLQKLPEQVSLSDMRNLVCELLFGLGLAPDDLPIFLLLVVDAYMGDRTIDKSNNLG
jgi:hypothetical protein